MNYPDRYAQKDQMAPKIKLDDVIYDVDNLTEAASVKLASLKFVTLRLKELNDTYKALKDAKDCHIQNLKKEILSAKAGIDFDK